MSTAIADAYEAQRRLGWAKETFGSEYDPPCMLGAAGLAWHDTFTFYQMIPKTDTPVALLARTVKELFPDRVGKRRASAQIIMAFNDHVATTYDEVCQVWEKAAIKEQELVS